MGYVADLHLHSPYAYACSKNLTLENLSSWAKVKGIDLLSSADFTHPIWRDELRRKLMPGEPGLYVYNGVNYVLGTEISCVYTQGGRPRRVHLLLLVPDFDTVDRLSLALAEGKNTLQSDGRPTLKMSARDFAFLALETNPGCIIIPAHVWTPWYGMLGSKSGFDSLEECFQDMTPEIHAVESGLSSDPSMIWPISELADKSIVSFSDAHSPSKLGRELTVFEGELSYQGLTEALACQKVAYTVEFYPEEGKYHYTGHRKCGVRQTPIETRQQGPHCPVCRRPLTLGVLHRAELLSNRSQSAGPQLAGPQFSDTGRAVYGPDGFVRNTQRRPPFIRLVPLLEIISETLGRGPSTKRVEAEYGRLTQELGNELYVLMRAGAADLTEVAGERVAQAVLSARVGDVEVEPGFDGVYGKVRLRPTGNFKEM